MAEPLPQKYAFDRNFFIPEGVENIDYVDEDDSRTTQALEDGDLADNEVVVSGDLETPDTMRIVSQTYHQDDNGRLVMDVVVDVEDIENIVKYDVRITKA